MYLLFAHVYDKPNINPSKMSTALTILVTNLSIGASYTDTEYMNDSELQ